MHKLISDMGYQWTHKTLPSRAPLGTLARVNQQCELYGQRGQDNLTVRKDYGQDGIRYLRGRCREAEFSKRKESALWNTKVSSQGNSGGGTRRSLPQRVGRELNR